MTPRAQRLLALSGLVPAAAAALVASALLVGDYVAAVRRAPADEARFEALEKAARKDPASLEAFVAEGERQTEAKQHRARRGRLLGYALAAAAILVVACGKWLAALRGERPPPLARLRRATGHLAPPRPSRRWFSRRRPSRGPPCSAGEPPAPGSRGGDQLDLSLVERVVERYGRAPDAVVPIVQAIQSHYGFLPDEALRRVCDLTEITPSQIAGLSTFYAQFRRSPRGRHLIKVCLGTACHVLQAEDITDEVRRHLEIASGEDTDRRRLFTVDQVACLGCCSLAPVMMIDDDTHGRLTPESAREHLDLFRSQAAHEG